MPLPPSSHGPDSASGTRRFWRKGDRAKVSILEIFRAAHAQGDGHRARSRSTEGEVTLTQASRQRREGVSERELRDHLAQDLDALLNTINLGSASDLSQVPLVAGSILNYGFRDLSSTSRAELGSQALIGAIRRSFSQFEPRLVPETLAVTLQDPAAEGENHQRLAIAVTAEFMGDPVDIPVDFAAEVDLGAGRLSMHDLQVQR